MKRTTLLAGFAAVLLAAEGAAADTRYAVEYYTSGDAAVEVECFAPAAPGRYPAILLLHGSGGLAQATHCVFRGMAGDIAAKKYNVFMPHFFDATGHEPGRPFRPEEHGRFSRAIEDAIKFVAARDGVDADRLGVLGMSMGAMLAFQRAARDERVKAVVSLSGSLPLGSRSELPPTLLLHGSRDPGTPVAIVRKFEDQLRSGETPVEVKIYPGVAHNFSAGKFPEVGRRSVAFLDRYLKPPSPSTAKKKR